MNNDQPNIELVLFDFGGVLAEEGFADGLMAIARQFDLSPEDFFQTATEIIYECGYVTGKATEGDYWRLIRQRTGITGDDASLAREIQKRFILRPRMIEAVEKLKRRKVRTAILSDQTDWLDQLNERDQFAKKFEKIINSFHTGKTKRNPESFTEAAKSLKLAPGKILFVDDNEGHISRAEMQGMQVHHFQGVSGFLEEIAPLMRQ